ncbi:MAG: chromosomal replication initiator protein DnaA [Deltaproteobacteria bacterium]|nr:chromosomal replication initiator protein DnaA [Candidatus Anaeroferrophillus wilburensis]MBN2889179.1 chromosomal replication initiator protein DnaA [Deltaproteobacteria bacterium]
MHDNFWPQVLAHIKEQVSEQNFLTWFKPIKLIKTEETSLLLEVPNRFFKDWLADNYPSAIENAVEAITGQSLKVTCKVAKKTPNYLKNNDGKPDSKVPEQPPASNGAHSLFNPKYTFAEFVVGPSNEFSHAAALAVAKQPGTSYNPLFIYSSAGLGKTHLLHAIGNHICRYNSRLKTHYVTSEDFTNDLISAIKEDKMPKFRNKYRQIDVLLIDDIQFIAGKERTQEEFFHTFNALYKSHKQIVLTSDKFPMDIPKLEDRLRTRFEWGLIADIQPPDNETLVAILITKANQENLILNTDVAFFLAENVSSNIRTLEGALLRIAAFSSFENKQEITIDFVKKVLKDIIKLEDKVITVEDIITAAAEVYRLKTSDIRSRKKTRNVVVPRQVAMYLSRKLTNCSYPDIADKFGGKDHSTVIYSEKKIAGQLKEQPALQEVIDKITLMLKNSH